MKASELRINNLVNYGGVTSEVSRVDKLFFYVEASETPTFSKDEGRGAKPIRLTEEWLLKFGFEKQMAWTYKISLIGNKNLVYYLGEKGWSIGNKNYSDFSCEYVHQLQNLYFALTGEELTFKPELHENRI